ncbi:glycoside hydrolase family 13 protein [Nocardioides mesophilus]|uniref:glycoside hydrolase family 13 protein n=1 Tax=Nocardioides mesophilus TaxID=433659 RepID=UPI001FE8103D|nr:glycoside hydrolase family 13 protein [Nocardioides mesophilus]
MQITPSPWWRDSVCYQIYVRSFADGDGDGVGDLVGIRERLPYLARLGVDSVWITPFYTSPQLDHGYDVADYRDVDPMFGTLADFDTMLATAHDLGIRVIVDVVPNHTSSRHPWFQEALAAPPGSPARDRYVFRDGSGPDGAEPPNNWVSMFGGCAWSRLEDGQWYLHLFDSSQPDLNWWNDEVGDEFESVLRFWLDRGVDGFRIDVAHGLYKPLDLTPREPDDKPPHPMWDQPEVHEVYRRWHKVLGEYDGERMAVAEAWVDSAESMSRYIRPDELQQSFNFQWLEAEWSAEAFGRVITETLDAVGLVGASPTWVLSNHDVERHTTRYGGGAVGLDRARAAVLTMMALPGSAYVYQGEELGLEQVDLEPQHRQDPSFHRTGGEEPGRDGCRVPIPWSGSTAPFGFGPGAGQPWLPMPEVFASQSVEVQEDDPASTLSFYKALLAMRRELAAGLDHRVALVDSPSGSLAFRRGGDDEAQLVCVVNCGTAAVAVPDRAGELLMSSGAGVSGDGSERLLPPDTAAWFRHA